MDVSPNITRTLKVAGMICLPVSGVLAGIAGVFFWLSATTAQPVETVQESTAWEAPSPLNIIRTGSLYLDSFKSASLYQTYEKAQGLLYARSESPQGSQPGMAKGQLSQKQPLLTQIANSMAIVPEAQAGTPTGDVHGKNGSIGKPEKKAVSTTAKPVVKAAVAPVVAQPTTVTQPTTVVGPSAPPAPVPTGSAHVANPVRATAAASVSQAKKSPPVTHEEAFPDTFKAGSLGQLTQLKAELEQLKMQVTIEETRSKLNQLRGSKAPSMSMPSLDFPPIGMPAASSSAALRILSIQSVNGKYSATVGTSQGSKIVHINDNINGSRVVSISRNSVVISRGQGTETLTIQE